MKKVKLRKVIAAVVATSIIPAILSSGASAEWKQLSENGTWSYIDNNELATNWKLIDGIWYNFDSSGVMRTGWINDSGTWYFTDTTGAMKTGWINDRGAWYFADGSGAMKTGWINDKGTWYFTNTSGAMQTGIVEVDGKVYSLASSGAMQTGKVMIDNKEYNFSNNGDAIGEIPKVSKAFDGKGATVTKQADKPANTETLLSSTATKKSSSNRSSSGNASSGNSGSNVGNANQEQDKWKMVWSDEFNGDNLDTNKWSYQYGNGTEYNAVDWGNNEKEFYTDKNTKVEDGNLIIEARKEETPIKYGDKEYKYSSARIRTLGKYSKTYGKIEAAITMPEGQGLWPAFWMLPDDNNIYGRWAAGGEIDIMEAKGRVLNNVWGTIHFGKEWPNNTSSGSHYTFPAGKDITGKHIYSVEWDPGEIRWYVDGELYYTANNWFSQGANEPAPYAYPAPFDRNFHIILNMAVGGDYDGGLQPDDSFKSAQMKVDYVRVYDLNGEYPVHDNPATYAGPIKGARTPLSNGSYIIDPKFKNIKNSTDGELSFDNWNFLTAGVGKATFNNSGDGLDLNIDNGGDKNYSVQLIDHVPLRLNKKYTLKFKAKADKAATVEAQFGGGSDRGWKKYSDAFKVNLTNEEKEYEYSFVMKDTPNVHGRLEFNLGLTNDINIHLNDVEVTEADADVEDNASTAKEPLENGNHIYNGSFNLGDNRVGFWDFKGEGATFKSEKDKEQAEVTIPVAGDKNGVILSQTGTNLLQSDVYKLTFKAHASKDRTMDVKFVSKDGQTYSQNTFNLTTTDQEYEYEFTMPEGKTDTNSITEFLMGNADGKVFIDDIKLIRTTNNNVNYDGVDLYPIKNGDFSLGYNYWQTLDNQAGSKADFSITDDADKAAAIDVKVLGTENWNVMLYSDDMKLSKGVNYTLEFDAWADETRDIVAKIEENANYTSYASKTLALKPDKQHVILNFTMPKDDTTQLKFLFGNTSNPKLTKVYIDNVSLKVKDALVKMPATLVPDNTNNTIGNDINIAYAGGDNGWKDSISKISENGNDVDKSLYTVADGKITLDKSVFTEKGDYNIVVKANGFDDTEVSQTIKAAAGTINHDNLIANGDFTSEFGNWGHFATTPAAATFSITGDADKAAAIDVTALGTSAAWDVMLFSDNINLSNGEKYVLEFDAWSDEARDIVAEIQENATYHSYAEETVALTPDKKHVIIKFTMPKDDVAQLKFCFGNTSNPALTKVCIDNVSLKVE
ncbi:beta-glucanase (GH16 family) [Clostridium saccharoperbutylacetonicum]|uniref:Glucan endo-1,3-beta-glucosidase A1 n=2 Tax=Clostridium TaxID=1485 RepID=M1LXP3_9CLOT|nr:carbohydrate binding domain-containing protein [Clostridium saccharoperbutylacetonicum]AGF58045.1 glucan endo-1,3-beta-glucosidase A1 [Clostridium saccharoperbutylacetonicum N1-4(HMT)]NRT61181.1 beta-glucanase (GH16 family) [Clostridium saccharoperbutylacetonicum]NSB24497.1 beta-glucanase (GH16 family) [Clostridium saccharoperbutylacetonicum]NSB43872.1 beta-glucanase (GH16 family) [Clostridium saccharoperbutylacetonicum]